MKMLTLVPLFAVLFSACGSSNSSDNHAGTTPNLNQVSPPTNGKVVAGDDLNAIFANISLENQFAAGLYTSLSGTANLKLTGQVGTGGAQPMNLNLNCPSNTTSLSVSLGIFDHKVYSYTENTSDQGNITFDQTTQQLVCGTPEKTTTIRVERANVPTNVADFLKVVFALESDQTITYYDQGSTFVAYLTQHTEDKGSKTDVAVSLSFQDPRTTPLQTGLLSANTSYTATGTDNQGLVSNSSDNQTLNTIAHGTMNLTSLSEKLKDVTLCDGPGSKMAVQGANGVITNSNCVDHQNVTDLIK